MAERIEERKRRTGLVGLKEMKGEREDMGRREGKMSSLRQSIALLQQYSEHSLAQ